LFAAAAVVVVLFLSGIRSYCTKYADDICLAIQAHILEEYCHNWHLKPNINKTVTGVFHLLNPLTAMKKIGVFLSKSNFLKIIYAREKIFLSPGTNIV